MHRVSALRGLAAPGGNYIARIYHQRAPASSLYRSLTVAERLFATSRPFGALTGRHSCILNRWDGSSPRCSWFRPAPCVGQQRRLFSDGPKEIAVPNMGDSITEGTINSWKKGVGEFVKADEVIAVIDTDKVSVDIQAPESGVIDTIMANEGDTVMVGAPLYKLTPAAAPPEGAAPAAEKKEPAPSQPAAQPSPAAPPSTPAPPATDAKRPSPPTPAAPSPQRPAAPGRGAAAVDVRGEKRVPMSRMRQRIAERLKGAQNTAAMLTTFNECDMGNLMALRSEINEAFLEKHGCKLGFVSAFMLAATKSLQKMPEVNGYIEGNEIVYKDYVDMSVAVATPTGLMVPVIRDCHKMTLADLEKALADLAKRARNNQIALEEMAGGTFTISNGGVYGSMLGTPILNPPQASILGMHAIINRPVARGKDIVIRPIMYLALTYDHRLVDGREAVTFLRSIRDYIEDPRKMLLDL